MWFGTGNQINCIWIRHGMTALNERHAYVGSTDEGLSEKGKDALYQLKKILEPVDKVYASPMKRCIESANVLFEDQQICVIDNLREIDFGEFEGKTFEELTNDARYQAYIDSAGESAFPKGESKKEFMERTIKGINELLSDSQNCQTPLSTIAVVAHGGTIMTALSHLYGGDYFSYQVTNAGGYCCRITKSENGYSIDQVRSLI